MTKWRMTVTEMFPTNITLLLPLIQDLHVLQREITFSVLSQMVFEKFVPVQNAIFRKLSISRNCRNKNCSYYRAHIWNILIMTMTMTMPNDLKKCTTINSFEEMKYARIYKLSSIYKCIFSIYTFYTTSYVKQLMYIDIQL